MYPLAFLDDAEQRHGHMIFLSLSITTASKPLRVEVVEKKYAVMGGSQYLRLYADHLQPFHELPHLHTRGWCKGKQLLSRPFCTQEEVFRHMDSQQTVLALSEAAPEPLPSLFICFILMFFHQLT